MATAEVNYCDTCKYGTEPGTLRPAQCFTCKHNGMNGSEDRWFPDLQKWANSLPVMECPGSEDAPEALIFPNPAIIAAMGQAGEPEMYDEPKEVPGMNKKAVGEINGIPLFSYNENIENSDTAVKFDQNKPRTDLIPPEAILGLADLYAMGARKYADRNWEKGMSYTRLLGALVRHAMAYLSGENYATDDKQHHMLSVAWCALAIFTFDCRGLAPEWDDRPDYQACPGAVAEVANLNNREVTQ